MKLTIGEIRDVQLALGKLKDVKLPAKTSYKVAKLVFEVEPIYKRSEEVKDQLIKKYGQPTEENKEIYNITNVEDFAKEWNDFAKEEEEISDIEINISDLGTAELTIDFFLAMSKIIKD